MHPLRSESIGIGWSTIVNFTAVTTVLRERGDPVKNRYLLAFSLDLCCPNMDINT